LQLGNGLRLFTNFHHNSLLVGQTLISIVNGLNTNLVCKIINDSVVSKYRVAVNNIIASFYLVGSALGFLINELLISTDNVDK